MIRGIVTAPNSEHYIRAQELLDLADYLDAEGDPQGTALRPP